MKSISRAFAAGLALAAGAALAGAAKADSVLYFDDDPPTLSYRYTAPRVYYSEPVIVAPAPRAYYYSEPRYVVRSNTTYYYAPSADAHVVSPAPYGYVPPGLSLQTPIGTYAPLYGGWNSYSSENVGGYNGYRDTNY